jgi:hypothetical protein
MKISQLSRILQRASAMHTSGDGELAKALGKLAEILKKSNDSEATAFVERVSKLRSVTKSTEDS